MNLLLLKCFFIFMAIFLGNGKLFYSRVQSRVKSFSAKSEIQLNMQTCLEYNITEWGRMPV